MTERSTRGAGESPLTPITPRHDGRVWNSRLRRYKPLPRPTRPLRRGKPLNKVGKRGQAWERARREFLSNRLRTQGYLACEHCGTWEGPLDVDHVAKRSLAPGRVLDRTNLRVLCRRCHQRRHEMAVLSARCSTRGHDAGGKTAANRRRSHP